MASSTPSGEYTLDALRDLAECRDIVEEAIGQFTDLAIDAEGKSATRIAKALRVSTPTVTRQRAKRKASAD